MINTNIDNYFFPSPIIRAISALFDFFIVNIFIIFFTAYAYEIIFKQVASDSVPVMPNILLYFIYIFIIPYITNGQTLGQYIFRLKTVSLLTDKLSFLQIVARQLASILGFNGVIKKNNQQVHDRLFQTTVIRNSKYEEFKLLNIKEKPLLKNKILSIILSLLVFIIFIQQIRSLYMAWL